MSSQKKRTSATLADMMAVIEVVVMVECDVFVRVMADARFVVSGILVGSCEVTGFEG